MPEVLGSGMTKPPKRPADVSQLAKRIVDISTGQESGDDRDLRAVERGRARADALTPEERREIAKKAAKARWNKETNETGTP